MENTTTEAEGLVAAFNLFSSESILVLDCCLTPGPTLDGAGCLRPEPPLVEAAGHAYTDVMDNYPPDNSRTAIVLHDESGRGLALAEWLAKERRCSRVVTVCKADLAQRYPFILGVPYAELPTFPSEVIPGRMFLGPAACLRGGACRMLGITHVVSVLSRQIEPPEGTEHLLCFAEDDSAEDLTPVMLQALPFISDALESGGVLLVHCERGASRSASVVVAHLLRTTTDDLDTLITRLRKHRRAVRPNDGFIQQLKRARWDSVEGGPAEEFEVME